MITLCRTIAALATIGTAIYAAEHHWRWELWLHLFGHDSIPAWIVWALIALRRHPVPSAPINRPADGRP
jgi:hypothetical protein